jgi:hypothetical protein
MEYIQPLHSLTGVDRSGFYRSAVHGSLTSVLLWWWWCATEMCGALLVCVVCDSCCHFEHELWLGMQLVACSGPGVYGQSSDDLLVCCSLCALQLVKISW